MKHNRFVGMQFPKHPLTFSDCSFVSLFFDFNPASSLDVLDGVVDEVVSCCWSGDLMEALFSVNDQSAIKILRENDWWVG